MGRARETVFLFELFQLLAAKKHRGYYSTHLRGRHSQSRESPIDHRPSHMRGSDARRQPHATASGYGAASTARGDDTPADAENVAVDMKNDDRWTKQLCASTATRVLLAMTLFGIIGTLLPVFAMRLGVRLPLQVSSDRPRRTRAFTSVGLGDRHRGGVIKGKGGEKKASLSVAGLGSSYGGETSLIGTPLKPCSGPDQAEATGWDRSGSCAWDPTDSGYHEVRPHTHTSTPFTRDQMPVRALLPKS